MERNRAAEVRHTVNSEEVLVHNVEGTANDYIIVRGAMYHGPNLIADAAAVLNVDHGVIDELFKD